MTDKAEEIASAEAPETMALTTDDVREELIMAGMDQDSASEFANRYETVMGEDARYMPEELIPTGKYEIQSENFTIIAKPESSVRVRLTNINGQLCFVVPYEQGATVNGVAVRL